MAQTRLGPGTLIKDALNFIDHEDFIPVLVYKQHIYVIDTTGAKRGQLYYTKFTHNGMQAIHSVQMPFSYGHRLGELFDRGEGLMDKHEPVIDTLPPIAIALINS